jgi:hypothetical protein
LRKFFFATHSITSLCVRVDTADDTTVIFIDSHEFGAAIRHTAGRALLIVAILVPSE